MKKLILIGFSFLLTTSYSQQAFAQHDTSKITKKLLSFSLSEGLSTSNDYKSSLKNYFSGNDVIGFALWVELGLGINFNLSDHLSISLKGDLLYSKIQSIIVGNGSSLPGEESVNLLILPGLLAKYYFNAGQTNSFFVCGGLSREIWYSDYSDFSTTKGIAPEGYIGYEKTLGFRQKGDKLKRGTCVGFKLGYRSIPFNALNNNTPSGNPVYQSVNYGGGSFSIYETF